MQIICSCGTKYDIPNTYVGKTARCKQCKKVFDIKQSDEPSFDVELTEANIVQSPFPGYIYTWAGPTALVTAICGIISSLYCCENTLPGLGICILLNPFIWLALYFWWLMDKIKCPHCGLKNLLHLQAELAPVGSEINCKYCQIPFIKPSR